MRDVLPDVPGLAELWGSVVAHGPFCHGHEFAGGTVVVQGASDTRAVVVVDDGPDIVVDGFFVRSASSSRHPSPRHSAWSCCPAAASPWTRSVTSLPGVYAAGDLAHQRELPMPLAMVLNAAAAGLTAAAACHRGLLAEQIGA